MWSGTAVDICLCVLKMMTRGRLLSDPMSRPSYFMCKKKLVRADNFPATLILAHDRAIWARIGLAD